MRAVDGLVFDEGEGLVVGGAVHEVGEASGELGFEGIGEGEDVEGDLFEFFEVGGGVSFSFDPYAPIACAAWSSEKINRMFGCLP